MTDNRHPRDIKDVEEFCKKLHPWSVSRRSDRVSIGFLAVLLEQGYNVQEGRYGFQMVGGTSARLFVAPKLDKPWLVIENHRDYFKAHAVCVQTVSALNGDGWAPFVDYQNIAARFMRTWVGNADELLEIPEPASIDKG